MVNSSDFLPDDRNRSPQTSNIYAASLLVEESRPVPAGETIQHNGNSIVLQHGPFLFSTYSEMGGWVIIGSRINDIKLLINQWTADNKILATATIQRQWVVSKELEQQAARALARMITIQVPGYHTLTENRKLRVEEDLHALCRIFIRRENKFAHFSANNIPIDRRPLPNETTLQKEEVQKQLLDLLDYYWNSVFIIWWKGFW